MSLLKSYSFGIYLGYDNVPGEVLSMFSELVEKPEKKLEFACVAVASGMRGLQKGTKFKDFNLTAFEMDVKRKNFATKCKRESTKLSFIVPHSGDDDYSVSSYCSISEDVLPLMMFERVKDAYEEVLLSDELDQAIRAIKKVNTQLFIEEGVDIIVALERAVDFVPDAIEEIKRICQSYPSISESIFTILNSGNKVDALFA